MDIGHQMLRAGWAVITGDNSAKYGLTVGAAYEQLLPLLAHRRRSALVAG